MLTQEEILENLDTVVVANLGEIGRLFGLKTAGCSEQIGHPSSGAGLRYSLTHFTVAFNGLLSVGSRSLSTHGVASHIDLVSVM